ncbi:peptidase inhibitor 16 [Ixodes scapularis]|uniref:peptidase inhibitor 16 n=1 Tax=Ixodes scapularis TaxID=6945 RepID=UPI001AD75180|nr:peptidase inhibitor 16 [Ixodes scapularis]
MLPRLFCTLLLTQLRLESARSAVLLEHERKIVVDMHNEFRDTVARGKARSWPPAADMLEMRYNTHLEELAEKHASHCIFEPGCHGCRISLDERPGQNMFAHAGPRDWSAVVRRWSHAQPQFGTTGRSNGTIQLKPSVLSQLLWSRSSWLGCAWKNCTSVIGTNIYVCNYFPRGNELSQHVYLAGESCSQCPKGTCCSSSSCPPARTSATNASPAAFTGLCTCEHERLPNIFTAQCFSYKFSPQLVYAYIL